MEEIKKEIYNKFIELEKTKLETLETLTKNNNLIIEKMKEIITRLDKLEKQVSGHGTLLVDLRGQTAVDFHCSFEKSDNIS